jgi:hypothetical protein
MTKRMLLTEALSASKCVISVMGDHAGEDVDAIVHRKIADIERTNRTFWLVKSPKAKPPLVQEVCAYHRAHVLFISPATTGGARPTHVSERAVVYSADGLKWRALPAGLGPITGKLDSRAYALVLDALETVEDGTADLWRYADFADPDKPIKMILGCSTVCATKKDMARHPDRLKSRLRRIVAVGRIAEPYCVFVR